MQSNYRRLPRPTVVKVLDLQSIGADIHIYGEIDDPGMRHINPSISWQQGDLKIAIRKSNFAVERHGKWYFRDDNAYSKTDVLYGRVDPDSLEVYGLHKLELVNAPQITQLAGLEDVRLFHRKDGMHAIGFESDRITKYLHNESTAMAEYLIKGNTLEYIRTLKKPDPKVVEKNWCPTDVSSKEFDFTYSPTQVWKEDKLIGMPYKGQIHGGSQLIKQKDGTWLSLLHKKTVNRLLNKPGVYDKYVYHHYLARHDKQGFVTELSEPLTFGTHENIEFAAGMVEHEDSFIMSFGIRDCKIALCKIEKSKLVDLLKPYKETA